jgi:hypothetical protein
MNERVDVRRALDILEIQSVIAMYSLGQDGHQQDNDILQEWDRAFASDATTDYSVAGAPVCHYRELARWMRGSPGVPGRMSGYEGWQHLLSIPIIHLSGDTAHSRTDYLAIHKLRVSGENPDQGERFDASGAFHDDLVRTTLGWRIKHRRLEVYFAAGIDTKRQMPVQS